MPRLRKSQKSLKNWGDQKWMTSGTHANKKRGSSKEVKSKGEEAVSAEGRMGCAVLFREGGYQRSKGQRKKAIREAA